MESELSAFRGGSGKDMVLRMDLVRDSVLPETIPEEYKHISPFRGLHVLFRQENNEGELLLRVIACQSAECSVDDRSALYPMLLNILLNAFLQRLKTENRAHICLMHASAAIRAGRAVLFSGTSGAGKSTAAKLLLEDGSFALLGDDMVLLSRDETGWRAYASPLGGDIPRDQLTNASAPVQAIYFLSQNGQAGWQRMDVAQALTRLIVSVVPAQEIRNSADKPIDEYDRGSLEAIMDDAALLAADVPCFSLAYQLEEPPWEQIFQGEMEREGV
jgi:hypothetical protein